MSKRTFMTNVTALPPTVSRDVVIAVLHDHHSMIRLNPLVLRHEDTRPPPNASQDEKERAVWYEITDMINYLPGGAVKGEVSYKACFYNLPTGLQTHVFAPAGVDIRSKWSVGGNLPGEPREPEELGLNVPKDTIYIREEVDLKCNIFMSSFVRRNLKKSHLVVADKIMEKADEIGPATTSQPGGAHNPSASQPPADRLLTRETSVTQPTHDSSTAENSGLVHYSYPPNCACEGTSHNRSCSFQGNTDIYEAAKQHTQKPFYAISLPSDSSLALESPSGTGSPGLAAPMPELYGSPRRDTCFCTGALHEIGCPSYPGLRLAQAKRPVSSQAYNQTSSESASQSHVASTCHDGPDATRLRRSKQDVQQLVVQQKTGEQGEVVMTISPHSDEYFDKDLIPRPLQTKAKG